MRSLLLAPHCDDEVLFAAWTLLAHRPEVIVVLGDQDDDARKQRQAETVTAVSELIERPAIMFLPQTEGTPDVDWITRKLQLLDEEAELDGTPFERVFAPAQERNGHDEHNLVGRIAEAVFGFDRVTPYLTYTRSGGRSTNAQEVPYEPDWISRKLRALACYESQHAHPKRATWFIDLLDLREWYAA